MMRTARTPNAAAERPFIIVSVPVGQGLKTPALLSHIPNCSLTTPVQNRVRSASGLRTGS